MTLKEIIDFCRRLRPGVPHKDETFLVWINEIEAEISTQVLLLDVSSYAPHSDYTEELLADNAHTKIYWTYLCAMIDLANGEYSRYQNDVAVYNGLMSDYRIWYADNYDPANGRAETSGYYISAYSLAVKHGFAGSEAEWVAYMSANAEASQAAQAAAERAQELAEAARGSAEDAAGAALLHKNGAEAAKTAAQGAQAGAEAAEQGAVNAKTAAETAHGGAATAQTQAETAREGAEIAEAGAVSAKDAAETAQGLAETAQAAAERAETAAITAKADAETAEAGAEAAEAASVSAKNAAETAKTGAESARTGAETAQAGSEEARTGAETAKKAAETAQGLAVAAKNAAETAKTGALAAQAAAETAKNGATSAKTAAETAKGAAEAAQSGAVSAKTAAETAKTAAETAKSGAVTAKTAAETAKTGAESARDAAIASKTAAAASESAALAAKTAAQAAQAASQGSALDAEAYACGTRNGTAVGSSDPAYHNNSKYYMEHASEIVGGDFPTKTEAQGYANTAKAEAIAAAAADATAKAGAAADNSKYYADSLVVYDVVIRTQAEFEALIASPTWLDAKSVCFIGDGGTLKFTRTDGNGVQVPNNVLNIQGLNNAIIDVQNFVYSKSTSSAALWRVSANEDSNIDSIEVLCSGEGGEQYVGFYTFSNMSNCKATLTPTLRDIEGNATPSYYIRGFMLCKKLINCEANINALSTSTIAKNYGQGFTPNSTHFVGCRANIRLTNNNTDAASEIHCIGFSTSTMVTQCEAFAYAINMNKLARARAIGFNIGNSIVNSGSECYAVGKISSEESLSSAAGFYGVHRIANCRGSAVCAEGTGYGFENCSHISNCGKHSGSSTTALFSPNCTCIDSETNEGIVPTAAFTQATARANLITGEPHTTVFGKLAKWFADFGALAWKSVVAKSDLSSDVQNSLGKADTALQSFTEADPTVPAWAKAETKPGYTAAEVGADTAGSAAAVEAKLAKRCFDIAILASGWVTPAPAYKDYPWAATVEVTGMLETYVPLMYLKISGADETAINAERDNFGCLCELVATDGYITLYAYDKPGADITARLEV